MRALRAVSPRILVDADACPVKDEIYKVAYRHAVNVTVVSNSHLPVPAHELIRQVVVDSGFDAADDWIAADADRAAIVVTADILLSDRCLEEWRDCHRADRASGSPLHRSALAIATRSIMADLRAGGDQLGGPAPFAKADRSRFLSALDEVVGRVRRTAG